MWNTSSFLYLAAAVVQRSDAYRSTLIAMWLLRLADLYFSVYLKVCFGLLILLGVSLSSCCPDKQTVMSPSGCLTCYFSCVYQQPNDIWSFGQALSLVLTVLAFAQQQCYVFGLSYRGVVGL